MNAQDHAEIVNLVNRYALAVDTRTWSLFDATFTPDCVLDFGPGVVFEGLDYLKTAFEAVHAPFQATQHATTNHNVRVDGDAATCLSYVRAVFVRDVGEGGKMFESTGWYDDELVRTDSGWRIARRVCRSSWSGGNPRVLMTSPEAEPPEGTDSLATEAEAGRLSHLAALLRD